ncbi:MAG: hypothetical protein HY063_08705 [Bacteroidetes bacterium]|nr:hypothetical protein [Bacteroidota bacterium]
MTTAQLKHQVIDKISEINDEEFLKAIKKILDSSAGKNIYRLSAEQRKAIRKGKQQIKNGEYITNEQLEKDEDKWLSE